MFLEDTKNLLSLLNGDHIWNTYLKKHLKKDKKHKGGKDSGAKLPNMKRRNLANIPMNVMDIR